MAEETTEIREAFQNPESAATLIHQILLKQYGPDVYQWDPITTFLEVKDDFDVEMHTAVSDKWNAMQTALTSNAFFSRLDGFSGVCNTFNTGSPFFDVFDPVTVEEASWGIFEVSINRPLEVFSPTILQYIRIMLVKDGYKDSSYPDILSMVLSDKYPSAKELKATVDNPNKDNVELYIDEQLKDMIYQFGKIPSLPPIDSLLKA